ncbi:o-succinylbenzoate synthase [Microbacterium sp. zg.Y1090]|uniref:o-succinylbenzoate synthase n=1 Tax=Microbacterium TaxID=33882 RepID=UPI00214ACC74|nr:MULTISPECIES: o-succinylbenzoate synthase [unclassified Microbacterium]MCR2812543.1 o-succinylbenzoate synthase [Microbacterium sp. zg.Y1084]MCR2817656.1 o-succinylbenzoate synthase [Microbacterium sp. zg.Y1090]MDL5485701.1 o-succinylbenzoate synthase [Microbacterium sp. zg-Y1211]WIM28870.1 o-succinylbenzoate synthase [Microbacterium sp. zg-Y1090]
MTPLPALDDILRNAAVVALPLATRFRGVDVREAVVLRGPAGWTEFSPFAEYDDAEASAWLAGAVDFGWAGQPTVQRDRIPVNATVPAVPAEQVARVLARYDGCRTAKVKVAERGQVLADDVARVRAVRAAMGPEGRVRVDANGGWNVDEAEHAVHALAPFDLEYVEQPCATVPELAELRARIRYMDIPVAADESVRKATDPLAVARAGAADILVVKAQPLGGVHRALRIVAEAGLPAVVSSALDTSVGLSMGVALAAALPDLDYDCGLGTAALFTADVTTPPLAPIDGMLRVGRVAVDDAVVRALAVDDAHRDWWFARIARCHALLAAQADAGTAAG